MTTSHTHSGSNSDNNDDTNNIYYSSNVKIGGYSNISPNAELEVNGDIITTGTVTSGYSDDRLKNYTSNIENPIDIIKSLNGYYFKPKRKININRFVKADNV